MYSINAIKLQQPTSVYLHEICTTSARTFLRGNY